MKRLPLLFAFLFLFSAIGAQNTSVSVYGGFVISRLEGDEDKLLPDSHSRFARKIGAQGGIMLHIPFNENFKIHTGIGYAQRGTNIESQNFSPYPVSGIYYTKVKIDYVEFPVLLSAGSESVYVMAGPQLAVEVKSDASGLESPDFGFKYGLGFEIGRRITAQLLLYHGFTNLTGESELKMQNRSISLAVGAKVFNFRSQESDSKQKRKTDQAIPHRTLD